MINFWSNIRRYPRFFISSLLGLILLIINPFRNLFKISKIRPFLVIGLIGVIIFFLLIITLMSGN